VFASFKLGKKIGSGFAVVIGFSAVAGVFAVTQMREAQHDATLLSTQEVPMLAETGELQKDCLDTLFAMRGFTLTGDRSYLEQARPAMQHVRDSLQTVRSLLANAKDAEKAETLHAAAETAFVAYQRLADETEQLIAAVTESRHLLEQASTQSAAALGSYLGRQQEQMQAEIAQVVGASADQGRALVEALKNRQSKIDAANEIHDGLEAVRSAAWQSLVNQDAKLLLGALPQLDGVSQRLEALQRITSERDDVAMLDRVHGATGQFMAALRALSKHLVSRQDLDRARLAEASRLQEKAAGLADTCAEAATHEAQHASQQLTTATWSTLTGIGISMLIGIGLALVITRSIVRPVRRSVDFAKLVATGNLTQRLEATSRDEIGDLSRALNAMVENLAALLKRITSGADILAGASTELSATSTQLASGAEEATAQSATVAGAAEEMSSTLSQMAESAGQVASSVRTVAAAVEQMTVSIAGVTTSAGSAASVAGDAARLAATSNEKIRQLGTAADAIGRVIEVIQDIADQTNLLALNATIEAARAGEAGKGFAVVASEVKALARQTAEATDDIRRRIEAIQGSTQDAVQSIGEISGVIAKVDEVSRSIATAMAEQSLPTKEIAQSVAQTTDAAAAMTTGVSQSAEAGKDITRNIAGVDQAARQTAQGASQVQTAGNEMSRLAEDLQNAASSFKL